MAQQNTLTQNTHTLVASFNDYSTARQAARELENSGIPADAITIDSSQKTAGAGSETTYESEHHRSGFSAWWNDLFGSDHHDDVRNSYETNLKKGSSVMLVTVRAELVDTATDILNSNGAVNVDDRRGGSDINAATTNRGNNGGSIEVIEEELQVGKRAIRRGGVRIFSHVVTTPVEEQVRLREEHVDVQRRAVNREINPDDMNALRDQTIEVTEMAEEPVVAKRARVREEIVVGKEATERTETVRDNVRHTEVEVENLTPQSAEGRDIPVRTGSSSERGEVHATGLSPNPPAPSALSGFGSTAGSGTLAGETTAGSAVRNFESNFDMTPDYRRHFEQNIGGSEDFETWRPAYEYGYRNARDDRYRGKSWDEVEPTLRSDYERNYPGNAWDRMKNAIRYGWERVTGTR